MTSSSTPLTSPTESIPPAVSSPVPQAGKTRNVPTLSPTSKARAGYLPGQPSRSTFLAWLGVRVVTLDLRCSFCLQNSAQPLHDGKCIRQLECDCNTCGVGLADHFGNCAECGEVPLHRFPAFRLSEVDA